MKRRVIGLVAGGTKLLAGVVDEDGEVLFGTVKSWPRGTPRGAGLLRFEPAIRGRRGPSDCPGRGCLEVYVSGPALAQLGYEYAAIAPDYNLGRILAANGEITGADVVQAAWAGDAGAREALERAGEKLGIGIANLLNLLDP